MLKLKTNKKKNQNTRKYTDRLKQQQKVQLANYTIKTLFFVITWYFHHIRNLEIFLYQKLLMVLHKIFTLWKNNEKERKFIFFLVFIG